MVPAEALVRKRAAPEERRAGRLEEHLAAERQQEEPEIVLAEQQLVEAQLPALETVLAELPEQQQR